MDYNKFPERDHAGDWERNESQSCLCPECRRQFRVPAGEREDRPCPWCGYSPPQDPDDSDIEVGDIVQFRLPHNGAVVTGRVESICMIGKHLPRKILSVRPRGATALDVFTVDSTKCRQADE